MIKRTPFPRFIGKQEFKRLFQELMRASGQEEVLEIVQLTDKLPSEAMWLKAGITDPKEAWEQLDERYRDKELTVLSAMHRLVSLKLPQGPAQSKVEALGTAVSHARSCLRALGAEKDLFSRCFKIETLVKKLAETTQSRWFYYQDEHPVQRKEEAFQKWLELEGKAAMRHRHKVSAIGYHHVPGTGQQQQAAKTPGSTSMPPRRDVAEAGG